MVRRLRCHARFVCALEPENDRDDDRRACWGSADYDGHVADPCEFVARGSSGVLGARVGYDMAVSSCGASGHAVTMLNLACDHAVEVLLGRVVADLPPRLCTG